MAKLEVSEYESLEAAQNKVSGTGRQFPSMSGQTVEIPGQSAPVNVKTRAVCLVADEDCKVQFGSESTGHLLTAEKPVAFPVAPNQTVSVGAPDDKLTPLTVEDATRLRDVEAAIAAQTILADKVKVDQLELDKRTKLLDDREKLLIEREKDISNSVTDLATREAALKEDRVKFETDKAAFHTRTGTGA